MKSQTIPQNHRDYAIVIAALVEERVIVAGSSESDRVLIFTLERFDCLGKDTWLIFRLILLLALSPG